MLKTESPKKDVKKTAPELELVQRLEKKIKKLELENFENEMHVSGLKAEHSESIKKMLIRVKVLENNQIHQELKVVFVNYFFFLKNTNKQ